VRCKGGAKESPSGAGVGGSERAAGKFGHAGIEAQHCGQAIATSRKNGPSPVIDGRRSGGHMEIRPDANIAQSHRTNKRGDGLMPPRRR